MTLSFAVLQTGQG